MTTYIYANTGANSISNKFHKLLDLNSSDAEEYYFEIERFFDTTIKEMMSWYLNHGNWYKWEFTEYCENLIHETGHYGSNVINGLRNYNWYLRNDKSKVNEQRNFIEHAFYLFILGVQSTEILYNEIFSKLERI